MDNYTEKDIDTLAKHGNDIYKDPKLEENTKKKRDWDKERARYFRKSS